MLTAGTQVAASEEAARAYPYRLLAHLLAAPPDQALLDRIAGLEADTSELGQAYGALARAAAAADPELVRFEYHDLFIGVGRGELLPYASYYLTGFLYERPLARLRQDMRRLGIARAEEVKEPEDHIAALCDMMAGLILGELGGGVDLAEQRRFFDAHLAPWAGRFFSDLEKAQAAVLYRLVGSVGRAFMAIETAAFEMV